MKKVVLFFALAVGLLTSASTAMAQTVNMSRYITLTVTNGAAIKLDFLAAAAGTPVRIVSGSNKQDITVGTSWTGIATYTADGTEMKVYGDIVGFGCSQNGVNLTALDVSNNTQLYELYCYGNNFSTQALDDIYCTLPYRTGKGNGVIQPVYNSSSANHATVLATNAQNAIAKNWKVQYYDDDTDIPTTGSYVCGSGGGTTVYDLRIAGVQVTSANCSDLSVIPDVSGTVKYDPTNKVLTLDGATIQINTSNAIDSRIDGLTIKVIGTNNLTTGGNAALGFSKPLTITGGGVLNANSGEDCGIYVNETNLTIDGCTVNAKGKYGIAGKDGSSEMLTIKNSTVTAEGASQGSIVDFASLTLDGCAITQPAGAAFDASLHAVALGGAVVKSKVVISPTGGGNPNMSRYITLTVKSGENIKLDLAAAAAATPVRIVSGSNTQNITVGTSWTGIATYTTRGTEMKVYGDLIGFDCSGNGANLTALDVSHNTQLRKLYCRDNSLSSLNVSKNTELIGLYCYGNSFSTSALDDIYCALPVRSASDNARIVPVESASAPNHATVLATNAQNATAKNWKVLYAEDNADVPTTGKHKCSATDIAEVSAEPALTLYPNPVADVLYLSATARTIRVYDIYGTEVAHATDTDRVEVSHLPAGVYTVRADGTVAKMVKR